MHGPLVVWPWHFKDNEDKNTKFKQQDFEVTFKNQPKFFLMGVTLHPPTFMPSW